MSRTIRVDTSALADIAQRLKGQYEAAIEPAAQAGAQVILGRVQRNVAALGKKTGKLYESLYKVLSQDNSGQYRATYHVSWNYKKAPHGFLVENGHWIRYAQYRDEQGRFRLRTNPDFKGRPYPTRRDSQQYKNLYWVPLDSPIWVSGKKFVASAVEEQSRAIEAARSALVQTINGAPR